MGLKRESRAADNKIFVDYISDGYNTLDRAIEWIEENDLPENVFSDNSLSGWAFSNGFDRKIPLNQIILFLFIGGLIGLLIGLLF